MNDKLIILLENYHIHMREISWIVCLHFKTDLSIIKSESREGHVVMIRNFVIYFLHKYLNNKVELNSTKHRLIGLFLLRDRLTIRHHHINISWQISNDKEIINEFNHLKTKFENNDIF